MCQYGKCQVNVKDTGIVDMVTLVDMRKWKGLYETRYKGETDGRSNVMFDLEAKKHLTLSYIWYPSFLDVYFKKTAWMLNYPTSRINVSVQGSHLSFYNH